MAKPVLVWILLSFQFLQCLLQEEDPSVGEYFQEAVDLMNRTRWRYFLPEDTDIDQDGNLSDHEVQQKFNTYVGELFKMIDHDEDNSITEEELRSLKLDIPHLTKAVDIALEIFPLKPFFLAADGNGDGFYDENDFYIPENLQRDSSSYSPTVTKYFIDERTNGVASKYGDMVRIGQKEGTVICKSLGYNELERVVEADEIFNKKSYQVNTYSCEGHEGRIEDCKQVSHHDYGRGMGVICKGEKLGLDALHLEGGINNSSGDIFLGNQGLMCHPGGYEEANSEVICRELGYPGLVRITNHSTFTGIRLKDNNAKMSKYFKCNGNEQKLADCPMDSSGDCHSDGDRVLGVICETDDKIGIDRGLSQVIEWNRNSRIWEEFGRFLFIADANGDGKLTLTELATKVKLLMGKILAVLDQNQDGKISLEDINLNLSHVPISNLIQQVFDNVTAGQQEIDLYDLKLAGQDLSKWTDLKWKLRNLDDNGDRKLNADDVYLRPDNSLLMAMLSEKLDKNQDGKIQREELVEFTDNMLTYLDDDHNNVITLDDVYTLLWENGFHCFQVGALRSFIKRFIGTVDNETKNFFGYVFHQFDIDGNGKISSEEFEKMHLPCNTSKEYSYDYGYNRYNDGNDPNAEMRCDDLYWKLWQKMTNLIYAFPDLELDSGSDGRGGGGYRRGRHDYYRKDTVVNKMANAACGLLG